MKRAREGERDRDGKRWNEMEGEREMREKYGDGAERDGERERWKERERERWRERKRER